MREAREILREYRERKRSEGETASLREENLRRLLRHVGAAHAPSEPFEERLLRAIQRVATEREARGRRWPSLARPAWHLWAPAALAVGAAVFASQLYHVHPLRELPERAHSSAALHPTPVASRSASLIGYVLMGDLLRRPGAEAVKPVGSGAPVYLGDEISTGSGTEGSIVFLDGSVCRALPNTTLRLTGEGSGLKRPRRLVLARGATWNTVEKGGPPFVVQTYSASATVWGTQFGVAVNPSGTTALRVKEGEVELQSAGASVLVRAGMQSVAFPGHAPQPPTPISAAPKPSPTRRPHPGPAPAKTGGAVDQSPNTFPRSPSPAPPPANSPPSPPPAPTDSSGAPASTDSEHELEPRMPISTSH